MNELKLKQDIKQSLDRCLHGNLADCAQNLFKTLGYQTDKSMRLEFPTAQEFRNQFTQDKGFNDEIARVRDWRFVDLLFQLTRDEITGSEQISLNFSDSPRIDNTIIESYLFFAIELADSLYSRSQLAGITRELNKLFLMPVMLVFKHGKMLTLSIINRRLHKRDESKDVLEKVTLIKDIDCANPHRAHVEILFDLSLVQLYKTYKFSNFVELHRAWQKTLDSTKLNKRFFQEISDWYFWARPQVRFPKDSPKDEEGMDSVSLIRLITRLIFVWFLKEKRQASALVPDELFQLSHLKELIDLNDRSASTYYKAILQNLFFATLNQEMNTSAKPDNRKFRGKAKSGSRDQHYMVHNVYRYYDLFKQPQKALQFFEQIPFLNGGLFECLDQPDPKNSKKMLRIDGFSDRTDNPLSVPNILFFSDEQEADLNEVYGTKKKRFKVRGLIDIFSRYKFTITENTPLEEEIALDPELLGKVFENLLAAYNPETKVTARKQTGSFYTPREVVDYMVDESLLVYLENTLISQPSGTRDKLRQLLDYNTSENPFANDPESTVLLIAAIDSLKVLDPAVGSGAFPMGMLQKLVFILGKLDPNNEFWKHQQKEREIRPVLEDLQQAQKISYEQAREAAVKQLEERLAEIEADFANNEMDYPRKLFLIENSIYGVDIQPIAVQIAKLRFFISLIVEQRVDDRAPNRGILPLPNLETKFIAANTLISIDRPDQMSFGALTVQEKEQELAEVRHRIFTARTQGTKNKYREKDKELREEIAVLLNQEGWPDDTATQIAQWNPYDQNASAGFFDPEWMFGIKDGFDVCIGNPPYVRQEKIKEFKPKFKEQYQCYTGVADLYVYFYERGFQLLKDGGNLAYITSNKWFRANYGVPLRKHIAKNYKIRTITDFGELSVFEAATFPMIFIASKRKVDQQSPLFTQVKSLDPPYPDVQALILQSGKTLPGSAIQGSEWVLTDAGVADIFKRMEEVGTPLGEYVEGQLYRGIVTGFNQAFVIDSAKRAELIAQDPKSAEIIKPLAVGDDVRKWYIRDSNKWLIFTRRGININQYPGIKAYLEQWKEDLTPKQNDSDTKGRKPGRYKWYEIQDDIAYYRAFETPKIVYPEICKEPRFAFNETGVYTNNKAFIIPIKDLYLIGILNSNFAWEYVKLACSALGDENKGGRLMLQWVNFKKLPIPPASDHDKKAIETLVGYILFLAKELKDTPLQGVALADDQLTLSYFEQLVNALVYELYLPADLHAHNLNFASLLQAEALPALDHIQGDKLAALRAICQRLYATDHPLRHHLSLLDTIPTIRIIEGKKS